MRYRQIMSADVREIRPGITETFVCPCGSQWFTRSHRFDRQGRCIESADHMQCDGCDRKHRIQPKETL